MYLGAKLEKGYPDTLNYPRERNRTDVVSEDLGGERRKGTKKERENRTRSILNFIRKGGRAQRADTQVAFLQPPPKKSSKKPYCQCCQRLSLIHI